MIKGNNIPQYFYDFVRIADQLILSGLDLNFRSSTYDGYNITPYNYALMFGHKHILQYLIDHGSIP